MKRSVVILIFLFLDHYTATANTYTVTSTGDNGGSNPLAGAGTGTLRQAIIDVNADTSAGPHYINFNIAASGLQTIVLAATLPTLSHSNVVVDGYTEPGASQGTFSGRVYAVVIDASSSGALYPFTILASNVLFRGFAIKGSNASGGAFLSIGVRYGVANAYSNVKFQGNFINVNATGGAITGYTAVSGAVHVYGNVSAGVSTAFGVVLGTDGDGVNDASEGNLGACATGVSSYMNFRDIDNSVIAGNWVGLQPDGITQVNYISSNAGLTNNPVWVANCKGCIVGTNGDGVSDVLERNVIADGVTGITVTYNYTTGIHPNQSSQPLRAPGNNQVTGNYVGTDATGNTATNRISNSGILIRGIGNYVGCDTSETTSSVYRNIVSCMTSAVGIYEAPHNSTPWNSVTSVIKGNYIGIGANGTSALTGGYGIVNFNAVNSKDIGNVIGNISNNGIYLGKLGTSSVNNSGVIISGNLIGVLPNAATPAANASHNILINSGETVSIAHNVIANSINGAGIAVKAGVNTGLKTQGITISENSIYNNAGLSIDLWPTTGSGVSANDGAMDVTSSTSSPNLLIDYPVITSAMVQGDTLILSGFVGSATSQSLFANARVEFFIADNSPANQDGEEISGDGLSVAHGEGRTFIGSLTTDASGNFSGMINVTGKGISAGTELTSSATDIAGNTSEFGANYMVAMALPVTLLSFDAVCQNNGADITWITTSETNNNYFEIQKSANGVVFNTISRVSSAGNSIQQQRYAYTDKHAIASAYYRLKQVDFNGGFAFGPTRFVNTCSNTDKAITVFPQPVADVLTVSLGENDADHYNAELFNSTGQQVLSANADAPGLLQIAVSDLPDGIYILLLTANTEVISKTILVRH